MSPQDIYVTKKDGSKEPVNFDKLHNALTYCAEGLDVSVSDVELKAHIQLFEGITTSEIHEAVIKSAADLISEDSPDYAIYAGRLANYHIRKLIYRDLTPPSLSEHVKPLVQLGVYDKNLMTKWDEIEFNILSDYIKHERDMDIAHAGMQQFVGKYLVQNRVDSRVKDRYDALYETPQIAIMLISMCLFEDYPASTRLGYVKDFYDAVSTFKISLPTPIMAGVRTPTRQFSSCVLIECGDSLDSINATSSSIINYVSKRAGIGVNIGAIRALGSEIRGGEAYHTGMIPFIKHFQTAVKSCSQGGVRGGAATMFYPIWHLEVESLVVLKNNRGVEENRARHLDYGVQINRHMYERMMKGEMITLFSPSDVPGLHEAFFEDQDEFERLYKIYEADESIRKKQVKALDLFTQIAQERAQTGRIYIQNVDHSNTHSSFDPKVAPVRQSNLCLEITLPTKPLNDVNDPNGEIALCTLSAFNLGRIDDFAELEHLSDLIVRALDSLLDYQDYPMKAAEIGSKARRTLGVGATGYAHFLAKNKVRYSDGSANALTHQLFEAIQFNLLKASNKLAQEKGACEWFNETKYAKGILPIDTYKKEIDEVCDEPLHMDWEGLRADILKDGLRNSTLTALMPCETSSQVSNSTNGIEPPRNLLSVKSSKDGILKQLVPDVKELGPYYETLWSIPSNKGYLDLVGIMQKFVDQAISANTNYDPARFDEDKVPIKLVLQDILYAYRNGLKTLYYHNSRDGASDEQENITCSGGACSV